MTRFINHWDLIDTSAPAIVGGYLKGRSSKRPLRIWARSASVWERRIAILGTFLDIQLGDPAICLEIAGMLLHDPHDLIQKAVGWMLREVGKRCSPRILEGFLDVHAPTMPRTMLRYAIERFPPDRKRFYMAMKKRRG